MHSNCFLKPFWLLLFTIGISAFVHATDVRTVKIVADGKTVVFPLHESPIITYSNNVLIITTNTSAEPFKIPVNQVTSIEFKGAPSKGDVNGDNVINYIDIMELSRYIMGALTEKFEPTAADVNDDGLINVADIVEIVNFLTKSK